MVIDASTWVDYLAWNLAEPGILDAAIDAGECAGPPHVDFEVGSALLRMERAGVIAGNSAEALITAFSRLPISRLYAAPDALAAIPISHNARYADAWYVALAHRLHCSLITNDSGMATAARMRDVHVIEPARIK